MLRRELNVFKLRSAQLRGRVSALFYRAKLPPGQLFPNDRTLDFDQNRLLDLAETHGPVFKIWHHGKLTICVLGIARAKEIIRAHSGGLKADTVDFTGLFEHGFLRAMEGEIHRDYRARFDAAFRRVQQSGALRELDEPFRQQIAGLARRNGPVEEWEIAPVIKRCASLALVRLVYGVDPLSDAGEKLIAAHDAYVPNGTPVVLRERDRQAFRAIQELSRPLATRVPEAVPPVSVLDEIARADGLDSTAFGCLTQMVEFGRFDSHGLWRWILHYLACNPDHADDLAGQSSAVERRSKAMMIVRETLRLQQSEAILRYVTRPFVYDGYYFPRRARLRFCIWEAHKDERNFAAPFDFRPDRFNSGAPPADVYAPLGIDHHKCLGASWTYELAAIFTEVLCSTCRFTLERNTPVAMGHFHFEPGAHTTVRFAPR